MALCLSPASYRDLSAHRSAHVADVGGGYVGSPGVRGWVGLERRSGWSSSPVHPWFTVLSGTVLVLLGERTIRVEAGQAAEFSTMVPHAFGAQGGPAEVIAILDPDGQRSHLRR